MRILRAAQHKRMPWKNGGGETTEIAVFPEHAGLDDFDWRVSMARVDGDGPFSSFPGIDRTLAILEGAGIVLDVAGQTPRKLTLDTEPHAFPADAPTSATLIGGRVIDFNVMSRRGTVAHRVERLVDARISPAGNERLVLCSSGSVGIIADGQTDALGHLDVAILSRSDAASLLPAPASEYYVVEFTSV
ncbi:MAG: HutD family protein [Rhizobium sp.]|nr:HutD family protein [Rhizobium sp.]